MEEKHAKSTKHLSSEEEEDRDVRPLFRATEDTACNESVSAGAFMFISRSYCTYSSRDFYQAGGPTGRDQKRYSSVDLQGNSFSPLRQVQ